MKTYNVTISARGGVWRAQRRKFGVLVEADSKESAWQLAMKKVDGELKGQYDKMSVTGCKLANHLKGV